MVVSTTSSAAAAYSATAAATRPRPIRLLQLPPLLLRIMPALLPLLVDPVVDELLLEVDGTKEEQVSAGKKEVVAEVRTMN